ncbi:NINE protein [Bartonella sp. CB74]|uniref:NINE protein n=1 Tax=Bartonella sp. CB74 TaxID=3113620 RepID=UPI002F96D935
MRSVIINQDQGTCLVSGDDGKRYQFATWDWLGKKSPKRGDSVNFAYENNVVNSIFPLLRKRSEQLRVLLAFVCLFLGVFGICRFVIGEFGTEILMILFSLSIIGLFTIVIWIMIDLMLIVF